MNLKFVYFFFIYVHLFDYIYTMYIPKVNAEFLRVTTIPLEARFMQNLDEKCTEMIKVIRKKGGAIREKTRLLPVVEKV